MEFISVTFKQGEQESNNSGEHASPCLPAGAGIERELGVQNVPVGSSGCSCRVSRPATPSSFTALIMIAAAFAFLGKRRSPARLAETRYGKISMLDARSSSCENLCPPCSSAWRLPHSRLALRADPVRSRVEARDRVGNREPAES
jgi:MYXO-CTERM domain-containing protein